MRRVRIWLALGFFVACAPFSADLGAPAGDDDDDDDDVAEAGTPKGEAAAGDAGDAGGGRETGSDGGPSRGEAYAALVRKDDPAAYWRCNDAAGSAQAADVLGKNPAIFASIGAPFVTRGQGLFGAEGGFCLFRGILDEAAVAANLPFQTPSFTLEVWFLPLAAPDASYRHLFFQAVGSGGNAVGYGIFLHDDGNGHGLHSEYWVENAVGGDRHHLVHAAAPAIGTSWHHIVATSGDGLWVDATKSVDAQLAGGDPSFTQALTFGTKRGKSALGDRDPSVFGRLTEVAVYGRALNEDQIRAHYEAGKP